VTQLALPDIAHNHRSTSLVYLLNHYSPRPPEFFSPRTIILAGGSTTTPDRKTFAQRIARIFPQAQIIEQLETPHSKIEINGNSLLARHCRGKQTLVLAELKTALRFSSETANTCPNYWHFSPYGFCPYNCHYCYLAGTPGVKFSPTVKIYLNLPEMLEQIERTAAKLAKPTAFYVGKLQDALALDPLTGYSRLMIPFFAHLTHARLVLLTKAADVDNLLDLDHRRNTILSWSLNPDPVCRQFEANTPHVRRRLQAMEKCAAAGYPIRAVIMPIIPLPDWPDLYDHFIDELLERVRLDRITLGGICSYQSARTLMNEKLPPENVINRHMAARSPDGRTRYSTHLRSEIYSHLIHRIRRHQPDLTVALCLEEPHLWNAAGIAHNLGKCNCVL